MYEVLQNNKSPKQTQNQLLNIFVPAYYKTVEFNTILN
jgi:hypothetical protein